MDRDHDADSEDVRVLVEDVLGYTRGDANTDGSVNILDLSLLSANWQASGGGTWLEGDFTGDGTVNILDLSDLSASWETSASAGAAFGPSAAATIPEPGTVALFAVVGAMVAAHRRRRGM